MRKLIIVTKKWGRNFTGATLATQYFTERWIEHFDSVSVYTLLCGDAIKHQNLTVNQFKSEYELGRRLAHDAREIKSTKQYTCYSDDHLGFLFSLADLPYIHTYHGNWPEAKYISPEFYLKSFYFIPLYKWTIRRAKYIINVSEYMQRFTKKYNQKSIVIHNGIECKPQDDEVPADSCFLMVGNVDQRKYGYAIKVLEKLNQMGSGAKVDIFGKILDPKVAEKLRLLPNVSLHGAVKNIPYLKYSGLINTSKMENLSISVCEAIKNNIPVFCFDVGGLSEVVLSGKTGYVFPAFDIAAMAKCIFEYSNFGIKLNVDTSVLHDFDWEIAADRYLEVFSR